LELLEKYKLFQNIPHSFRDLRDKVGRILGWLDSEDARILPISDCLSQGYWKICPESWKGLPSHFHRNSENKELPATSYHSTAYWTSMPQVATLVGLQESEPEINSKDKNINLPLLVVTSKVESHQIDSVFEDFIDYDAVLSTCSEDSIESLGISRMNI
jgi:hypothetical protein